MHLFDITQTQQELGQYKLPTELLDNVEKLFLVLLSNEKEGTLQIVDGELMSYLNMVNQDHPTITKVIISDVLNTVHQKLKKQSYIKNYTFNEETSVHTYAINRNKKIKSPLVNVTYSQRTIKKYITILCGNINYRLNK